MRHLLISCQPAWQPSSSHPHTCEHILGYYRTSFLATFSDYTVTTTDPIVFDANRLNPGGHYNNRTGIYTVPLDGIYQITFHIWAYGEQIYSHLVVDGTKV